MQSEDKPHRSGFSGGEIATPSDLVKYQDGSIVSRVLVKNPNGTVTIFAFDEGQALSEHMVPYDALVHVLEGEVEITIDGTTHHLHSCEMILLPASQPHAVNALKRFKMILTMIRC